MKQPFINEVVWGSRKVLQMGNGWVVQKKPWTSVHLSYLGPKAEKTQDVEGLRHFFFRILFRFFVVKEKTPTLPETNSSPMTIPIFPGKYHQNGGFSMAMLVSGSADSH